MKELELFSLDGFGGWFRRTNHNFVPEPGQVCANCATELKGRFCYQCGQDADTHHRTIGHLIFEAFEGLFHLDGRLWRTLPPLFFTPGRLARDLLDGKMARHVPPFRIFLVALLLFMFAAEFRSEEARRHPPAGTASVEQMTHIQFKSNGTPDVANLPSNVKVQQVTKPDGSKDVNVTRNINLFAMTPDDARYMAEMLKQSRMKPQWLRDDLVKAFSDPERFQASIFTWGHRLALLLLPILGVVLGMLYAGKKYYRKFYLYDHLLVAMNLLSFVFFTNALGFILPDVVMQPWGKAASSLWMAVNFFQTLRGAYGSSILGASLKTLILMIMTGISFLLLLAGVMLISLTAV